MATQTLISVALASLLLAGCTGSDRANPEPSEAAPSAATSPETCAGLDELVRKTRRGYVAVRSAEVIPIPAEPNYIGTADMPPHSGPWDYLTQVPLVFYGPGVVPSRAIKRPITLADLAPTTAGLIGFDGFDAPDGEARHLSPKKTPKLVVSIVWDGAGWNTLQAHEDSWPFLRRAIRHGVSFEEADIGSSPSNTPPIHTTIGTGAFPKSHGIPHVKIGTESGGYIDPYESNDASLVEVPSLGDVYDRAEGNRPKVGVVATVNWHLGMIGHGAQFQGGDHDTAVLLNDQGLGYGNSAVYDLAEHDDQSLLETATDRLDSSDGERDGHWNEDPLDDLAARYATPAFVEYQQAVLETTIREEGFGADEIPDLMYVNFKQPDDAGHRWGMTSEEVGANLRSVDDAFKRLTRFLNDQVGKEEWVVVITADHGQTTYPRKSGAWPIRGNEVNADIEEAFKDENLNVLRVTAAGIFLADRDALSNGKAEKVAEWLGDYSVAENVPDGEELPDRWKDRADERLFSVVLAGRDVVASSCSGG